MVETEPAPRARLGAPFVLAALAALAAAVLVAYGVALDDYFYEIDDAALIHSAQRGLPTGPHFRPLHPWWNTWLYRAFGLDPKPYHAVSLAVHALSSCLCFALAWRLLASKAAALGAGLAFACIFSGCEAVIWICADGGLLAVACVLAACLAWHTALASGKLAWHAAALAAAALAMGFKEEAVALLPLWVGIDLALHGWRGVARASTVKRYAPIALLALAYLALAFRPELWSERPDVRSYTFTPALVPELFANFALLGWPGHVDPAAHGALPWIGAVLALALAAAARAWPKQRALIGIGLATALFAMLPTLPGPFAIVSTRYSYASVLGIALIAGGLLDRAWPRPGSRLAAARALAVCAAFALFLAAHVVAIRSMASWRFERGSERLERLLATTTTEILQPLASGSDRAPRTAFVVGPGVWNPRDYFCGVAAILGHPEERLELEWVALDELTAALAPGGRFDPATRAVFTGLGDGTLARVAALDSAFVERLRAIATKSGEIGYPNQVPVVAIAPR